MHNDAGYVTTKKAKEMLQVCAGTLRNWDKANRIRTIRTPSNIRLYNLQDIQNILRSGTSNNETSESKRKICYARVSSKKQMDDLKRQEDLFGHRFPNYELVADVASGINWKRKGLRTILDAAMRGEVGEVVVAHRDRLARFGFELIEWILETNGCALVVLDRDTYKSEQQELADDILSIVHIYSCRQMGKRRYSIDKNSYIPNSESGEDSEGVDGDV